MTTDWTSEVAKNMSGNSLYQRRARMTLPILVRQASAGQKIFYADLARELGMRLAWNLNYVLGSIGKTLHELGEQWNEDIPAIQCIVVNQKTGLPGSGVDRMIAGMSSLELDPRQKEALVQGILSDVFTYPKWPQVLQTLNLQVFESLLDTNSLKVLGHAGGGGETNEHKSLKKYVAEHPECVGLARSLAPGAPEHLLPSGDKIDVVFVSRNAMIGVEVKARVSNEQDLLRGLFQCVKYHAVLKACRAVENTSHEVRVLMAIEGRLPDRLIPVKNTLGVSVYEEVRAGGNA